MMMEISDKIASLNLLLPSPSSPGGNYVAVNVRERIAYIAIQFPKMNDQRPFLGRLGDTLTTEEGYQAAKLCAMNVLAHLAQNFTVEQIVGLNHMDAYFQAVPGWDQSPQVVDGASDLFVDVLGEKGKHSRAIFGVAQLPKNFPVGITTSWTLR